MEIGTLCYHNLSKPTLITFNRNDPLVSYEFELIKSTLEIESTLHWVLRFQRNIDHSLAHEDGSYKALFTERGNLRRLCTIIPLAFFALISGVTLAAFYLNIILVQVGITKPLTQVCTLLLNITGNVEPIDLSS